jgi:hypothetical protein
MRDPKCLDLTINQVQNNMDLMNMSDSKNLYLIIS